MGELDKTTALFSEYKWTNEKVDLGMLETMIERSKLFKYKSFFSLLQIRIYKGMRGQREETRKRIACNVWGDSKRMILK